MSRNLTQPFFPTPPAEYSRDYFDGITRSFSTYVANNQNPGEGRNTGMVLTNLQTDDSGLENGALFQQNGFVKIALINTPHVRGQQADSAVGSVTVSTP